MSDLTDARLSAIAERPWIAGAHEATTMAAELLALRARAAELEAWQSRAVQQARRAADDTDRWNTLWQAADGQATDLADMIDAILAERDTARARVTELEDQLREKGNRVGRLEDLARTACADGADARAHATELEALVDRVRAALADHPRCDVHPDTVISCGWKLAVASVQAAVDAAPAQREPIGYVVVTTNIHGERHVPTKILTRDDAEEAADYWRRVLPGIPDARVVGLREVGE
ncbi:hypothetical protein [Nocardia sp. NPDC060249]|uniref:hypothetical protein n=1 Tax=Nocardia sp. NPDC060249 TaxID=3347082 RepID=UPI0036695E32